MDAARESLKQIAGHLWRVENLIPRLSEDHKSAVLESLQNDSKEIQNMIVKFGGKKP